MALRAFCHEVSFDLIKVNRNSSLTYASMSVNYAEGDVNQDVYMSISIYIYIHIVRSVYDVSTFPYVQSVRDALLTVWTVSCMHLVSHILEFVPNFV